jgi:hypothetical protein
LLSSIHADKGHLVTKQLPWILAITHAVLASLAFGLAMSPLHADIFPLIVAMVDLPASVLASWLSDVLRATGIIDALIGVVVGSIWFYLIGVLLQVIVQKLKSKYDLV